VIEAQHMVLNDVGLGGTLVLVSIPGDDGKMYQAIIYLPDKGFGVTQFLPTSENSASGVHFGYAPPPANLFDAYPNFHEEEQLPFLAAKYSSVGCTVN